MNQNQRNNKVTIVMPCLNEEKTIRNALLRATEASRLIKEKYGAECELLVSDNGSTDNSEKISRENGATVIHCKDLGYGSALRYGIDNASGNLILIGDSDGSHDFKEAVPMIGKLLNGDDICIGSRFKGKILSGSMPWANQYIGNPILTFILNLLFRVGISDAQCGMRAFSKDAYNRISPNSTGMEFASELLIKAGLLKLKISEVPITQHPDDRDRAPHLRPMRDGWRHLRYLILLSPTWMFFLPAFVFFSLGLMLSIISLTTPTGISVHIGSFITLGDHWAIIAGGFMSIGHLMFLFGTNSTLISVRDKYRLPSRRIKLLYKATRLAPMIIIGVLSELLFISGLAYILITWSSQGFSNLHMLKELAISNTFFILGIQNIFFGFFLFSNLELQHQDFPKIFNDI